jgi:hypothetical protein
MSHFYGVIETSSRKNAPTACATIATGLVTVAASFAGAIRVTLHRDEAKQIDNYYITQSTWEGSGVHEVLAVGTIGEPRSQTHGALLRALETVRQLCDDAAINDVIDVALGDVVPGQAATPLAILESHLATLNGATPRQMSAPINAVLNCDGDSQVARLLKRGHL